jgi:hypothetical protein
MDLMISATSRRGVTKPWGLLNAPTCSFYQGMVITNGSISGHKKAAALCSVWGGGSLPFCPVVSCLYVLCFIIFYIMEVLTKKYLSRGEIWQIILLVNKETSV